MKQAWSTIVFKAAQAANGKRTFTGTASTPSTDRMGDVVEPTGAQYELPIPLLWQHDSSQPIGWVRSVSATGKGIEISGEVADVPDAGTLKYRLLEAWQSMTAGLVRGLSIGFSPIEYSQIPGGVHFTRWAWLELSAVTIPANADCSITAIKRADARRDALRLSALPGLVVRLGSPPGESARRFREAGGKL